MLTGVSQRSCEISNILRCVPGFFEGIQMKLFQDDMKVTQ